MSKNKGKKNQQGQSYGFQQFPIQGSQQQYPQQTPQTQQGQQGQWSQASSPQQTQQTQQSIESQARSLAQTSSQYVNALKLTGQTNVASQMEALATTVWGLLEQSQQLQSQIDAQHPYSSQSQQFSGQQTPQYSGQQAPQFAGSSH